MSREKIVELLRDRAMVGRMEVRDKQLMLEAADAIESANFTFYNWQEKFFDTLHSIIWYDGHYEWLKAMRDDMEKLLNSGDKYVIYNNPFDTTEWHTEQHTIYMILVGMFGDWGTSIRSGWIDDIKGCIEFIDAICKDSWEEDERRRSDNEQREAD